MSKVHLSIGTAVQGDRISLIQPSSQAVYEWEPSAMPLADTFSESSLGDGRILSSYREENAVESMRIHIKGASPNLLIKRTQEIRRMLIKARDYWATAWQGYPVYLQARGACETNMRYAIVYSGALPSDVLPWGDAFGRANVMQERTLTIERGPWMNVPPGTGNCAEISAGEESCFPQYLLFGGGGEVHYVNVGSAATIDDLPTADFEIDGWIRPDAWGGGGAGGYIFAKANTSPAGWYVSINSVSGIQAFAYYDATDAWSTSGPDEFPPGSMGDWLHFLIHWDFATTTFWIALNGVWVVSYGTQTAGNNVYQVDASEDAYIGYEPDSLGPATWNGGIAWMRIRNAHSQTPGIPFTVPERCVLPPPFLADANCMGLWIYEGTGDVTVNLGSGGADADIVGAEWRCACPYEWGFVEDPPDPPEPTVCQNVSCRVYNNAAIPITNSALTTLDFNQEHWDTDNVHDTVVNPSRLTAPVDGKYLITLHIAWEFYSNGDYYIMIRRNGVLNIAKDYEPVILNEGCFQSISKIVSLTAGEYVEAQVLQTSTAPAGDLDVLASIAISPEFSMHLVGCS